MAGAGVVSNRGNTFNAFQYFYQGLYASSIDVGILDVDIMTVGDLTVTTAAVSLASVGALYGNTATFTGALSAGSVATAAAAVSLATLGNTYAATLNVSGASVLTGGATLGVPLSVSSGGTGLTSVTAGQIPYGNGTSALSTNANLTTDGTKIHVGTVSASTGNYLYQLNNTDSALLVRQDGSAPIQVWNALGSNQMSLAADGRLLQNSSTTLPSATTIRHLVANSGGAFTQYTDPNTSLGVLFGCGSDGSSQWYTHTGAVGSESYTQLMVLTAAGNLGIGTSTPAATLHVAGDSSYALIQPTNAANATLYMRHGSLATNSFLQSDASQNLIFGTADAEKMRLTGGGDLGIGTTTPSAALHVIKTAEQLRLGFDTSNYLAVQVDSGGGTTFSQSGSTPFWSFYGDSASGPAKHVINNNNANAYGALTEYRTQNTVRGYIGALKHGSAADVLFTGETTDGFGIRAETALEAGISTAIKFRLDSTATRFYNSSFRIDQTPAGTAGAATGTYFTLNLNGTDYKIALLADS